MPKRTIAGRSARADAGEGPAEMPLGEGWTYEPKWDGFRTIVAVDRRWHGGGSPVATGARWVGTSRSCSRCSEPARRQREPFVADGEIVRVAAGRMDFDELQLRLHPAESRVRKLAAEIPATLIVFDLLRVGGGRPARAPARGAARAARVVRRRPADGRPRPAISTMCRPGAPCSSDRRRADPEVARAWFADDAGIGQDGIIAKRADQPYLPGERGWVKVKHRSTLDCVVGGYRLSKTGDGIAGAAPAPGSLRRRRDLALRRAHLVVQGEGTPRHARGAASARRVARASKEAAPRGTEPLERRQGAAHGSRCEPVLVCEVTIDRMQYGRFRHAASFVRWRDDREPVSCTFEQLPGAEPPAWPEGSSG